MKTIIAIAMLFLVGMTSRAETVTTNWTANFANSGVVLDGNLTGWSDTRTIDGIAGTIADVNVSLTLSGGNNGDLYAYLEHSSGFSVLLNRPGRDSGNSFGYGNPGMTVTFADSAINGDIHYYGGTGVPSGTYQPDARNISPLSSAAALSLFDRGNNGAWLNSFTNLDVSGTWTLFVADVVGGGSPSTVADWGLTIDYLNVPEPSVVALAGLGLALGLARRRS